MVIAIVKWHIMNTTLTIDPAGRIVLPKPLRDELRLEAGDMLHLESEGEHVTLRPVRSKSPLRKERGVWVFYGGGTLTVGQTNEMVGEVREGRNREIRGEKP